MKEYKVKDLLTIKNGRDHKHLGDGLFPVYGSGGIMRYADDYLYDKPSILLPRKGTLDNIQYCDTPFWCVDTTYYSEVNDELANPYYLYRYLNLLDLKNLDSGTALPSMTFDSYYQIKVNLPDIEAQNKIAKALYSLDQKISLNTRMNAELEAMAKQLYDYWFVQFDFPFDFAQGKPDENGKPYKSSGGKMVWNEKLKREIPETFKVVKLGDSCDVLLGGTPDTTNEDYWNGDYHWLNSGEVAEFPILNSEKTITEKGLNSSATAFVPKGSVTLSITRHLRPSILAIDACINQSVVAIKENVNIKKEYLYPLIGRETPRYMTLRTGAQQPHINKETVESTWMVMPTNDVLDKYYRLVKPFYQSIITNAEEIEHLFHLRNSLLPMLMNGQVTIE